MLAIWLNRSQIRGELLRFCTTGALAVLLNTGLIVAFTEIGRLHYAASIVVTFTLTTLVGFVMNREWTFTVNGRMSKAEVIRYFAISLMGVSITLAATGLLVEQGAPYYIASFGVAIVLAPLNFILHRYWSFGLRWIATQSGSY